MGCANIAKRSMIPALLSLPDKFQIIAIASRTYEKACEYAELFGIRPIVGYDTLLQQDIDAIYMPLPTGLHSMWIEKSLLAGKHVYAEKSFAMTLEDATHLVNLAREKKIALMEGYMFLYHKQHRVVKDLIYKGYIGNLRGFNANFAFPPFSDHNNFRYDNVLGGGALKDSAGYVLRAVDFICEQPYTITDATIHYSQKMTSLYGSAYVKFDSGVSGLLSFGFDNFYQCNYSVWGTKGKIYVSKAFTPKPDEETIITVEQQDYKEVISCKPFNHFVAAMEHFYNLCNDFSDKETEYNSILLQSKGLDTIEKLSKI